MNEIYNIISENKNAYGNDKNIEELTFLSNLKKRTNNKFKFLFLNKNRNKKYSYSISLHSVSNNDNDYEIIPFESNLIKHICPVLDYYVIIAYLPESLIKDIEKLPNIISCTKSIKLKNHYSNKYYNKTEILKETKWKELKVQENEFDFNLINSALSIMSQGKYFVNSSYTYDNNYYYPSSAGKGIDIYIIDDGLDVSLSKENFDTYKNTPDERIIACDGIFYDGQIHIVNDTTKCYAEFNGMDDVYGDFNHGTLVAISAIGTLNGIAKKANLHSLAIEYYSYDVLTALDYIKQHATPHKSVVNISSGLYEDEIDFSLKEIQDKISELNDYGIIIIASAGNDSQNCCKNETNTVNRIYGAVEGVIKIGAINNKKFSEYGNMENIYEIASYSNFGKCVDLFAPGTLRVTDKNNEIINVVSGTSFSAPFVAGLAATIMAENPHIQYNYESLKKKLIELSIPNIINGLDDETPNRLANNGKRSIYGSSRCNDSSKINQCGKQCCTKYGVCVDPENYHNISMCLVENGCEPEFGYCSTKKCSHCEINECCSKNGSCVINSDDLCHIENGCQTDFGNCNYATKKCGEHFNNRKCEVDECCSKDGNCINVYDDENGFCFLENGCLDKFSDKCFSKDPLIYKNYEEEYVSIVKEYICKEEINKFMEYCYLEYIIHDRDYYDNRKRNEVCNFYQKHHCKDIIDCPNEFFPFCIKNDMYYMINEFIEDVRYNNIYCSRRNPTSRSDYCIPNNDKMYAIYGNLSDFIINDLCPYEECRESYLDILNSDYQKMKIIFENRENRSEKILRTMSIYEKTIELLSSNQCNELKNIDFYLI